MLIIWPVTQNNVNIEYLFQQDANKAQTRSSDLVVMVYNSLDYYAPTLPREIALMSWNCPAAFNLIEDAFNIINKVHFLLPSSTAHESLALYICPKTATLTELPHHRTGCNNYCSGILHM